jgi:pyruvate dehydrogenase E2 component (dihydrolipoamide acetyltransferase)
MAKNVVMPALEMAQETGTIVSWLKNEGDQVSKGEALLEIETDKAVVEVEASADGVLAGVKAQEGAEIPVGETIAWIVAPGEQPPEETTDSDSARAMSEQARPTSAATTATSTARAAISAGKDRSTARISPKARRLAKERGVDLSTVRGTGPQGAITGEDVLAAANSAAAAQTADASTAAPLSTVARLMAERTLESWTQVPHFFLSREVDASALIEAREKLAPALERERNVRVTYTDFLVALAGRALRDHPKLNASWEQGLVRPNSSVNVSLAMAVEDGVVSAVISDADDAGVGDIALRRRELAERAHGGRLQPADISGGTFTISNLGMYGIDAFSAIIVPPQAAILAVGRIADRVVAVGGQPVVRPYMTMTLSCDHRVVDGARAAEFLDALANAVEKGPQEHQLNPS